MPIVIGKGKAWCLAYCFVTHASAKLRELTAGMVGPKSTPKDSNEKVVPTQPFRILDAPYLRDDFYCSILAYSPTSGYLAVGLGCRVYLWCEALGVQHPPFREQHPSNYVTSLSFSSEDGGKSILAVGRRTGMLSLWNPLDTAVRFEISHPSPVTCVSFKPTKSRRPSKRFPGLEVDVEDLVVGDDRGNVWYYSVEWPDEEFEDRFDWSGAMTLLAKISAHIQQVCGLAWSPNEAYLATGGNDNSCLLFDLAEIIPSQESRCASQASCSSQQSQGTRCQSAFSCLTSNGGPGSAFNGKHLISQLIPSWVHPPVKPPATSLLNDTGTLIAGGDQTILVPPNRQKHRFIHSAAVKAIAFAPWQPSLLATGGGTNDRAIHFFHTLSGSCLATINVYAQVTSLIWSKTRREIVATFGFSQPEHPFRIAVFAWPSCEQVAAIPWGPDGSSWDGLTRNELVDCGRALCAISYPGSPPYLRPEDYLLGHQERCSPEISSSMTPDGSNRDGRSPFPHARGPTVVQPKAKEGGLWCSRTMEEGCIIVASSDQTVKFHEVWSGSGRKIATGSSPFGGSQILEGLEGIEMPGNEIIR